MIGQLNRTTKRLTCWAICLTFASVLTSDGFALDRIRDRNGVTTGKITKMSALAVTIRKGGTDLKKPVEDIVSITFDDEPEDLAPARRSANNGRYEDALERLAKIARSDVDRKEVQQEIDFLSMFCKVQLALSGQGSLDQAESQVASFLSKHSKSYHVPEAIELRGTALLANGDYNGARQMFTKLGKAPAPYFKARSALLTGRSLQAEGKHQQAAASFDAAIKAAESNAAAKSQLLEATLLNAVSQAALGQLEAATEAIKQIVKQAETQDRQLLAQAYNALGDCYLQAKESKAAMLAFLHVDILFSTETSEHARALYELSKLWEELGKTERARDAGQRLQENYPGSRWASR